MDNNIKKFSKEWFVHNQSLIDKAKKVNNEYGYSQEGLSYWEVDAEEFVGTKEQMRSKFEDLKPGLEEITTENIFSYENLIDSFGGVDAIFDLMDLDGDGNITLNEVNEIASADTEEFADEIDTTFLAKDLDEIYQNAIASEGATYTDMGDRIRYKYKDGSVTTIKFDDDGKVSGKTTSEFSNKELKTVNYNYETKTKNETIVDSQGRIRYASTDANGRVNDKSKSTLYSEDDNQSRLDEIETAGRKIVTLYDEIGQEIDRSEEFKYKSDGVIGDTKQKSIGDCWVLAAVNALKELPEGKKIIQESISQNSDGSVTVNLRGVNRSYTFTPEEIGARDYQTIGMEYSDGGDDVDMNLIEMAIGKYRQELLETNPDMKTLHDATMDDPLNGAFLEDALEYLTGKPHAEAFSTEDMEVILDQKQISSDSKAVLVMFEKEDDSLGESTIESGHAYSVYMSDDDAVFIVNPWNSKEVIIYPKEEFLQNCKYMVSINL